MSGPEAASQRVYFALWPDAATAARLHALALDTLRAAGGGRAVKAESMHLTLAFIGAVDAVRLALLASVADAIVAEPVDVALDRLGVFRRGGILYAGMHAQTPTLAALHRRLTAALAAVDAPTEARFTPHVTLARHVHAPDLAHQMPAIAWRSDSFSLVESQLRPSGAHYRVLHRFALKD